MSIPSIKLSYQWKLSNFSSCLFKREKHPKGTQMNQETLTSPSLSTIKITKPHKTFNKSIFEMFLKTAEVPEYHTVYLIINLFLLYSIILMWDEPWPSLFSIFNIENLAQRLLKSIYLLLKYLFYTFIETSESIVS